MDGASVGHVHWDMNKEHLPVGFIRFRHPLFSVKKCRLETQRLFWQRAHGWLPQLGCACSRCNKEHFSKTTLALPNDDQGTTTFFNQVCRAEETENDFKTETTVENIPVQLVPPNTRTQEKLSSLNWPWGQNVLSLGKRVYYSILCSISSAATRNIKAFNVNI